MIKADIGLKGESLKVFNTMVKKYQIVDDTKKMLVRVVAKNWERSLLAEAEMDRDGIIILDRYGNPKPHPGNELIKQARDQMMKALRQLDLSPAYEDDEMLRDFSIKGIRDLR